MSGHRQGCVTIVGAGVVGLSTALEIARRGLEVTVIGGEAAATSASAVAAGMIAPASEALLDGLDAPASAALLRARRRWEAWGGRLGVHLDARGALHFADSETLDGREREAARLGFYADRRDGGLWLADDAVVDPGVVLQRLEAAAVKAGARLLCGQVEVCEGVLRLDGAVLEGEVVVAAGWGSAGLADAALELAALRPIKGQLLRILAAPGEGPTLRTTQVYVTPASFGWTVGATMEPGRFDLTVDHEALARLRASAAALRPALASGEARAAVGVRAATADGAPLVGRSCSGVWLATGLRRNGWLLAPLVAEGIAAYLAGGDVDASLAGQARAWDPARVLTPADAQGAA